VDDVERLKLNWVGNIDRHQRWLFWMLMELLLTRIAGPLRAARALHDMILAAEARARRLAHLVQHSVPSPTEVAREAPAFFDALHSPVMDE